MRYILFDIGGSKSRVAISADGERIAKKEIFDTPDDFNEGIERIVAAIKGLIGSSKIGAVAGGLPGPLDRDRTMSINPPNLPAWKNMPFKAKLTEKLGIDNIYLVNDAAAAGIGEALYGAGQGYDIVAYLTISTGIGGARIINGNIDVNSLGFEPGHQIIDISSGLDLEETISGSAIEKRYGKKAEDIHDKAIWEEIERTLAVGLNNTIVHWSPDIVVLGGSMIDSIDIIKLREYTAKYCRIFPTIPPIVKRALGDDTGLYGAMGYLKKMGK